MEHGYWILKGREPVKVATVEEWGRWFDRRERHVGSETIGDAHVSTVFLGLDHNHAPSGPPVLFETMIFVNNMKKHQFSIRGIDGRITPNPLGALSDYQDRCSTYDEAEAMHARAVQLVREAYSQLEQIQG